MRKNGSKPVTLHLFLARKIGPQQLLPLHSSSWYLFLSMLPLVMWFLPPLPYKFCMILLLAIFLGLSLPRPFLTSFCATDHKFDSVDWILSLADLCRIEVETHLLNFWGLWWNRKKNYTNSLLYCGIIQHVKGKCIGPKNWIESRVRLIYLLNDKLQMSWDCSIHFTQNDFLPWSIGS